MKCALHPDIETNLRCGKCGQPICPKCAVQTPVGARCPKCAALKRLPVYDVSVFIYARAIAAGLISASALGAIWYLIPFSTFFLLFIALGVGYAIGEIISISVNKKRGRGLQLIAGVSAVLAYSVRSILEAQGTGFLDAFVNIYSLIALALCIVISIGRVR